jgi:hypothetical protein
MADVSSSSSSPQSRREEADRIVGASAQLNLIRSLIEEAGLDPIWVHLIKQFGSVMYLKALESSPRRLRARLNGSA